ncbi:MAG: transposase [Conexivisphaera sp.]
MRSSRKPENECHRNLEAMWLMRKLAPDFRTIADFRKDHLDLVKQVFIKFNSFLEELGPFKSRDVAMDGTKVKAVNSTGRSYTGDYLEISIDEVNELMDKYVKEMDENDAREEGGQEMDRSKVQEIVKGLDEKREFKRR